MMAKMKAASSIADRKVGVSEGGVTGERARAIHTFWHDAGGGALGPLGGAPAGAGLAGGQPVGTGLAGAELAGPGRR